MKNLKSLSKRIKCKVYQASYWVCSAMSYINSITCKHKCKILFIIQNNFIITLSFEFTERDYVKSKTML